MQFYSGFSLTNEEFLFQEFIEKSEYNICGFSYGSISAIKITIENLKNNKRVDRLQLFSPVFFQTKSEKFKRVQLMGHKANNKEYMKQFLNSCFAPYPQIELESRQNLQEDLEELLRHKWIANEFEYIESKGVKIEVYLGGEDKIIDVAGAREFFTKVSTVTYIKNANHFLQTN